MSNRMSEEELEAIRKGVRESGIDWNEDRAKLLAEVDALKSQLQIAEEALRRYAVAQFTRPLMRSIHRKPSS